MSKWKPIEDKSGMKIGSTILVFSETESPKFGGEPIFSTPVMNNGKDEPTIGFYYEHTVTHWRPMVKPPKQ